MSNVVLNIFGFLIWTYYIIAILAIVIVASIIIFPFAVLEFIFGRRQNIGI